ncbi:MAG: homoserine kinase [Clostridia bacterium]|nr:homoserine kinase [Clostridia bacterium]
MSKVKVRVPGTSANIGPGFDSLGLALTIYNYIEAEETESGLEIEILDAETKEFLPTDEKNLVYKAMKYLFEKADYNPKGLKLTLKSEVPVTRGLGSSSACIVGGLVCANELCGNKFSRRELMAMATKLEGHSDNVCAAMTGGFTVSVFNKEEIFYYSHKMKDDLKFVVLIPDYAVTTQKARNTLPGYYPKRDVAFNISHASLLVASIVSGDYENILCAMDDRIHEPYRKVFIDGYNKIYNKLKSYGSLGTYISGSGPTLISVVEADDAEFLYEDISEYMKKLYPAWTVMLLEADNEGAKIIK